MRQILFILACLGLLSVSGCSSTYYSAMEKVGIHKRDILVDRVQDARDSQDEARRQFRSALEEFDSVVKLENSDLKQAFDALNSEYQDCRKAAEKVSHRIDKVENVSEALFDEWEQELSQYQNRELKRLSRDKLKKTRRIYMEMIGSMRDAEASMEPVLAVMKDNVLFLKHNLNAQAIGSLKGEFASLKSDINDLIAKMNAAIDKSDTFIAHMDQ